jgi:phage terminase large subunit-like protein
MLKTDSRGSRLAKESKSSARKIDLAVAAVMAFDRAQFVKSKPVPQFFSF